MKFNYILTFPKTKSNSRHLQKPASPYVDFHFNTPVSTSLLHLSIFRLLSLYLSISLYIYIHTHSYPYKHKDLYLTSVTHIFSHSLDTIDTSMAHVRQLPCDGEGICLLCKVAPSEEETLICVTCVTPWHVNCLSVRPETLASTLQWNCPDCTSPTLAGPPAPAEISGGSSGELVTAIRSIEADASLTEVEKARRRQELLSGGGDHEASRKEKGKEKVEERESNDDVLGLIDENLKCSICIQLLERPVTVVKSPSIPVKLGQQIRSIYAHTY